MFVKVNLAINLGYKNIGAIAIVQNCFVSNLFTELHQLFVKNLLNSPKNIEI